jgi:nitrogen regulatory protein PII
MKAIFIAYNQALTEKVEFMLDHLNIRGFSMFPIVYGRGSETGEPRMGTHTWPETNSGILTIVDDSSVEKLLEMIRKLDNINTDVGIRAFVWDVEKTV